MFEVTFYVAWDEVVRTFPSYDAAQAFIEETGMDPDEFDIIEEN
jgi:hypothetical protein